MCARSLARAPREEKKSIDLDFPSLYLSVCRSGVGAIAVDCDVTGEMGPPLSPSLSFPEAAVQGDNE